MCRFCFAFKVKNCKQFRRLVDYLEKHQIEYDVPNDIHTVFAFVTDFELNEAKKIIKNPFVRLFM